MFIALHWIRVNIRKGYSSYMKALISGIQILKSAHPFSMLCIKYSIYSPHEKVTDLVNLKDGHQRCVQVIRLRLLGIIDLNRVLATLQVQHRRLIKILREQIHVHGGGHHDDLEM